VLICPHAALVTDGWARLVIERCTECNRCYYTCPNDCFVPEATLELHRRRVAPRYDVIVIGAGLGGLMAATALAQQGRSVAVFEKLGFAGGRYTQLDYRDAAVATAAWTSMGPRSHIGRFLSDLGVGPDPSAGALRYIGLRDVGLSEQYSVRCVDGRHFPSLLEMLSPATRRDWLRAIAAGRHAAPDNVSAHDYIAAICSDPDLLAAVDAIATTTSGVGSRAMPAREFIQIVLDARAAGADFAMPAGGVAAIINALTNVLAAAGGDLYLHTGVGRIAVTDGRVGGVDLSDGRPVSAPIVVHNAGPARLIRLLGADNLPAGYLAQLRALRGANCAALVFATREALFDDAPIVMTPGCRRVSGVFSPTRLDPSLSREGLHLYDAFFPLRSADRKAELILALADLRALFPTFEATLVWQLPMFFTGSWPGTESAQTFGQTGDRRLEPATPIAGLYLVGMDGQGSGVAGDVIPQGVRRLLDALAQ
jgi:phytoene dehydrogenase-like protein